MVYTIEKIIEYFIELKRKSFMEFDSGLDLNEKFIVMHVINDAIEYENVIYSLNLNKKFIAMHDSLRCLEAVLVDCYYKCLKYRQIENQGKKCKNKHNLMILFFNVSDFREYVLDLRTCKTNYIAFLNGSYPELKKRLDEIEVDLFHISTGENVFDLYYDFWDKAYILLNNIKIHDCEKCNRIDIVERDFMKEPHI